MRETLYYKCLRVIDSSDTLDRMAVAGRYLMLARGILSELSYSFISRCWIEKWKRLQEEKYYD